MKYRVTVPSTEADASPQSFVVETDDWMTAFTSALKEMGQRSLLGGSVICDVQEDNSIIVTLENLHAPCIVRAIDESEDYYDDDEYSTPELLEHTDNTDNTEHEQLEEEEEEEEEEDVHTQLRRSTRKTELYFGTNEPIPSSDSKDSSPFEAITGNTESEVLGEESDLYEEEHYDEEPIEEEDPQTNDESLDSPASDVSDHPDDANTSESDEDEEGNAAYEVDEANAPTVRLGTSSPSDDASVEESEADDKSVQQKPKGRSRKRKQTSKRGKQKTLASEKSEPEHVHETHVTQHTGDPETPAQDTAEPLKTPVKAATAAKANDNGQKHDKKATRTELKETGSKTRNHNLVEAFYLDFWRLSSQSRSSTEWIEAVASFIFQQIPSEAVYALLEIPDSLDFRVAYALGTNTKKQIGTTLDIGTGILDWTIKENNPFLFQRPCEDETMDPSAIESAFGVTIESLCSAPINEGPRVYGALLLVNAKTGDYNADELQALEYVSRQLGSYLFAEFMSERGHSKKTKSAPWR